MLTIIVSFIPFNLQKLIHEIGHSVMARPSHSGKLAWAIQAQEYLEWEK